MKSKVKGATELIYTLNVLDKEIEKSVDKFLEKGVQKTANNINLDAPVLTGYLKANVGSKKIKPLEYVIYSEAYYSAWVEDYYIRHGKASWFYSNISELDDYLKRRIRDVINKQNNGVKAKNIGGNKK